MNMLKAARWLDIDTTRSEQHRPSRGVADTLRALIGRRSRTPSAVERADAPDQDTGNRSPAGQGALSRLLPGAEPHGK